MLSKLFEKSFFRFMLVGFIGELIYLFLFFILSSLNYTNSTSVVISGIICIIINIILHARISFKVRFNISFSIKYILIQAFCLLVCKIVSEYLTNQGYTSYFIGIATLIFWSLTSYFLCRLMLGFKLIGNFKRY